MGSRGHGKRHNVTKQEGASQANIEIALNIMPIVRKVAEWKGSFSSSRANELRCMLGLPLPGQKNNNKKPRVDIQALLAATNLSQSDLEAVSTAWDVIDRYTSYFGRENDLLPFQFVLERTKEKYEAQNQKPAPQEPPLSPHRPVDTSHLDNPITRILRAP